MNVITDIASQGLTGALAEQARTLTYGDLPHEVRAIARQCVLDYVACTLAGAKEELADILLAEMREQGGAPAATVIGHAERGNELLRIQSEQMCARRRGTEAAKRAGGVKAEHVVVAGRQQQAESALQFIARDERGQHIAPGAAALLGQREQRRQQHDRRMSRHRQIDVVEIERVRRGAVDQRGRQHR